MTPRRATGLAAALLALAALCLWASSRMTWVTVASFDGLGEERTSSLGGGVWAAATTPLAIALIAAVAAIFAVRGTAVYVLAILVTIVAVGAAVPAVNLLAGRTRPDRAGTLAELPGRASVTSVDVSYAPAVLVLAGSVVAVVAAVLIARTPAARRGLSAKYDSPAVRKAEARRSVESGGSTSDTGEEPSERALWDALDSGLDPTADPYTRGAPKVTDE